MRGRGAPLGAVPGFPGGARAPRSLGSELAAPGLRNAGSAIVALVLRCSEAWGLSSPGLNSCALRWQGALNPWTTLEAPRGHFFLFFPPRPFLTERAPLSGKAQPLSAACVDPAGVPLPSCVDLVRVPQAPLSPGEAGIWAVPLSAGFAGCPEAVSSPGSAYRPPSTCPFRLIQTESCQGLHPQGALTMGGPRGQHGR